MPIYRHLVSGCGAVCPEDWFDLSSNSMLRTWPRNADVPSPFWGGPKAALRELCHPGQREEDLIKVDIAHTFAIAGYGKEWLASALVFVTIRCNIFGEGTFDTQLEDAYASFAEWCRSKKKVSSIQSFDKTELKITSLLVLKFFFYVCRFCRFCHLRLRFQDFPRGLGKGADAGKVGAWLDDVLRGWTPSMVPVT